MSQLTELIELIKTLASAEKLKALLEGTFTGWAGYALLFVIIFAETGLLAGFFLPGDSLLFVVGVLCGAGKMNFLLVNALLMIAAITGDGVGYMLGRSAGRAAFNRPNSRFFKREYLERTQAFYEKYGGKTIIYARFVPIIRTFAPFVAGIGQMSYPKFLSFNVFGGIGWVFGLTGLGYIVGDLPFVKKYFDKVILAIILVSVLPVLLEAWKARNHGKRSA
jgi:membrane-associated protein